ncbi:Ground-like domain protein [Aphelenchoides bicaudatus]|nr:Ground-like domain protein [Aphelenchoides bicaudatus]
MTVAIFLTLLSLLFVTLVHSSSNVTEKTTASPATTVKTSHGGQIPLIFHHRASSQKKRHRRQYQQPPNGLPRESGHENSPANTNYFYPPRMPLPLSNCFFNPTGYACCNAQLNDLMVETYSELEAKPNFHVCNINAIASMLQSKAEKRFNVTFETVAGFEDFAQKVHFNGDLICKIELGSKYMLAYATAGHKNGANGANGSTYNKYSGEPLKRQKRQVIYGPENELPPNHITKQHSMWI